MTGKAIEPRLDPAALNDLGRRCKDLFDSALQERSSLEERWRRNRLFFLNQPDGTGFGVPERMSPQHFPLVQPKIAALVDNCAGTIRSTPVMLNAVGYGSSDDAEVVGRLLSFFFDIGGLKRKLSQIMQITAITGICFVRPRWEAIEQSSKRLSAGLGRYMWKSLGIQFDVFDPVHVAVSTSRTSCAEESMAVGHTFYRTRAQVRVLVDEGYYACEDVDSLGSTMMEGEGPRDQDNSRIEEVEPTSEEGRIKFVELLVSQTVSEHLPDKVARYGLTMVADTGQIVRMQPYIDDSCGYFDYRLMPEEHGSFWPSSSVGNALQGLQVAYNAFHNLARSGTFMAAFPPVVEQGAAHDSVTMYEPGTRVSTTGREVTPLRNDFNPALLLPLIEQVEKQADAVVGISMSGTASANTSGGQPLTATAEQIMQGNQSTRLGGYMDEFSSAFERMAAFCQRMLLRHIDEWFDVYMVEVEPLMTKEVMAELLERPWRWQVAARGPGDSPQSILAKTDRLMAMSQQMAPDPESMMQSMVQSLTQFGMDPQTAMQAAQQAVAGFKSPINMDEVIKTAINALDLNNPNILVKPEEEQQEIGQPVPDEGLAQLAGLLGQAQGAGAPQYPPIGLDGLGGVGGAIEG